MNIGRGKHHLERKAAKYVTYSLDSLEAADGFADGIEWDAEVVDGLTVEEIIGALCAAEARGEWTPIDTGIDTAPGRPADEWEYLKEHHNRTVINDARTGRAEPGAIKQAIVDECVICGETHYHGHVPSDERTVENGHILGGERVAHCGHGRHEDVGRYYLRFDKIDDAESGGDTSV